MKTYVQPGKTITLTAPYAVTSGDGLLVGSIFGVAAGTAALGETVEAALVGVYEMKKLGSQA
jgi:predicted RecA/RadA family phage recombinase